MEVDEKHAQWLEQNHVRVHMPNTSHAFLRVRQTSQDVSELQKTIKALERKLAQQSTEINRRDQTIARLHNLEVSLSRKVNDDYRELYRRDQMIARLEDCLAWKEVQYSKELRRLNTKLQQMWMMDIPGMQEYHCSKVVCHEFHLKKVQLPSKLLDES